MQNTFDLLRHQMMTVMALKESTTFYQILYSMILMLFLDEFFKILPRFTLFAKTYCSKYFLHKSKQIIQNSTLIKTTKTASILLEKDYKNKSPNDFVDSILEHITKLSTVKYMRYQNTFFIHHREEFEVTQNIFARCVDEQINTEGGAIEYLKLEIYSYHHNITYLREFLTTIYRDFMISKKNQLGDQRYYFENLFVSSKKNSGYLTTVFEKQFQFTMTPFHTNKNLTNIYGDYMDRVVKRVNFFIHNKDWYQQKGIPHTLGLLLHGEPGCGKTSLIKAIAKATNRHIFSISLNEEITQTQMKNLFYSEEVMIVNKKEGKVETLIIPIEQRIYVMEDVDCMSQILYQREDSIIGEDITEMNYDQLNTILSSYQTQTLNNSDNIILPISTSNRMPEFSEEHRQEAYKSFSDMRNLRELEAAQYMVSTMNPGVNVEEFTEEQYSQVAEQLLSNTDKIAKARPITPEFMRPSKSPKPEIIVNKRPKIVQKQTQEAMNRDSVFYPEEDEIHKMESKEKLTLSFILNLLDGILETPGRILIMTSNFPEKLDRALIRPGRIDLNIQFTRANRQMIEEMFNHFYDNILESTTENKKREYIEAFKRIPDNQYTPAEINRLLFENFENPDKFIQKFG
jgi:hypothetical protein